MDREDFGDLAAFAVIAEGRSFTRAAARLGLSPSALSHAMRGLEERLRVRLLSRRTRSVSTTEAGERLLVTLRPALGYITHAVEEFGRLLGQPAGRVRVTTTRQAATMFIAPVLPQFSIDYPDVIVELVIEAFRSVNCCWSQRSHWRCSGDLQYSSGGRPAGQVC